MYGILARGKGCGSGIMRPVSWLVAAVTLWARVSQPVLGYRQNTGYRDLGFPHSEYRSVLFCYSWPHTGMVYFNETCECRQ